MAQLKSSQAVRADNLLTDILTTTQTHWSTISANTTASNFRHQGFFVDTTAAPVTLTLPASPQNGDSVSFVDDKGTFATNILTINGNGNLIMGLNTPMTASTNFARNTLVYFNSDWRLTQ